MLDLVDFVFFESMRIFLAFPPLALVPSLGLALLYFRKRKETILFASVFWLVYAVYESYMTWVWSPTVPFLVVRVDLLLISPVLYVATGWAIWSFFRK